MPVPNLSKRDYPVGPYRDKRVIDISSDDYENDNGFTCQVATAGNITYRTLHGEADQTESGLAVGDVVAGPGGVPVVLVAVRASSTVTSIVVGII